ncbi:MAG: preprotein translocase subunit SecE [bacterium]|nr:preprotein translocase subunit SecE [bacterium]
MAKSGSAGAQDKNIIARGKAFFQEVMVEMNKVAWPSKNDLKSHTVVVMFMLLVMAGVIFVYDQVFLRVVKLLLLLG